MTHHSFFCQIQSSLSHFVFPLFNFFPSLVELECRHICITPSVATFFSFFSSSLPRRLFIYLYICIFSRASLLSRERILCCILNLLVIFFNFTASVDARKRFDVHSRFAFYSAACLLTHFFFSLSFSFFQRFSLNVSEMENPFFSFFPFFIIFWFISLLNHILSVQ